MSTAAMKAAVASELKADNAVSTRVGSRIYLGAAVQNPTYPYIVIRQTFLDHVGHMTGSSKVARALLDISAWHDSNPLTPDLVLEDVRQALDHKEHATIGNSPNTQAIRAVFMENQVDDYVPPIAGGEGGLYGSRATVTIWFDEAVTN